MYVMIQHLAEMYFNFSFFFFFFFMFDLLGVWWGLWEGVRTVCPLLQSISGGELLTTSDLKPSLLNLLDEQEKSTKYTSAVSHKHSSV